MVACTAPNVDSDARLAMVQGLTAWACVLPSDECAAVLTRLTAPSVHRIGEALGLLLDPGAAKAAKASRAHLSLQFDVLRAVAVSARTTIDKHAVSGAVVCHPFVWVALNSTPPDLASMGIQALPCCERWALSGGGRRSDSWTIRRCRGHVSRQSEGRCV